MNCPTCQGRNRETTDMVCMTCGRDYLNDDPVPGLGWKRLMLGWQERANEAIKYNTLACMERDQWADACHHAEAKLERERIARIEAENAKRIADTDATKAENQTRHWKEQEAKQRRLHHEQGDWKHCSLEAERRMIEAEAKADTYQRMYYAEDGEIAAQLEAAQARIAAALAIVDGYLYLDNDADLLGPHEVRTVIRAALTTPEGTMTADPIRARLDSEPFNGRSTGAAEARLLGDALRAVLNLHAPFRDDRDGATNCRSCSEEDGHLRYPCPTVRAMRDALGVEVTQ